MFGQAQFFSPLRCFFKKVKTKQHFGFEGNVKTEYESSLNVTLGMFRILMITCLVLYNKMRSSRTYKYTLFHVLHSGTEYTVIYRLY